MIDQAGDSATSFSMRAIDARRRATDVMAGDFCYTGGHCSTEDRVRYPIEKSEISSEEMERRREALREADGSNRIEGIYRDPATDEIFEAFIRGDIELDELGARLEALPDPE